MSQNRVVYVIDDDDAVRESAVIFLDAAGYETQAYESGVAFLKAVDQAGPGCILLDIHMPALSGLEVQQALNELGVKWPVIVLTGQGDIATAVQAMKNGAFEFLEKPYQNDVLIQTVAAAFDRLEALSADSVRTAHSCALLDKLSNRERQVMQGLLQGLPNKLIAYELDLSVRTVELYRANVMEKLEARGLSSAVRIALVGGLEPLVERRRA
jgi:two-component system response regulator FixJ